MENMYNVKEILDKIASTSSRNEKETILKQNKDNELLKEVLQFVYNPFIVTGLSDKKMKKNPLFRHPIMIDNIMDYLKENNTGTDVDIYRVKSFIQQQPQELQGSYYSIVTKNLKIGVTAKTINKILGKGFIPEFNVMLADKYADHESKVKDFIITEKLDGIRNVLIKENGKIKMFSRQGQVVEGLNDIEIEADKLLDNYVYDGELLLRNDKNLNSADLYRATVKEVRKDGVKKNVEFYVFDMLPLDEFVSGKSKEGCFDRKAKLFNVLNTLGLTWIKGLPNLYVGDDKSEIARLLSEVEEQGKEGLMLNTIDGIYECKRSKNLLKVKSMQTVDLRLIGFEEGTGKYVGKLGRINVEYKGNTVGVGSGFSDEERIEIWNNQEKYLGKIAEIQFFEETKNQNDDKLSLRFPVWKGIRFDKDSPSYF